MSNLTVALAGNPNVGKSTVFNTLTGMRRHTGNWAGKTVDTASGSYKDEQGSLTLVDLPGTYSILSRSEEERIARDYIESGEADATVVVCDASCLARNLILVLQILSLTGRVAVCVNLLDEAEKKGVRVDLERLAESLGVPVAGTAAARGKGLDTLVCAARTAALSDRAPDERMNAQQIADRARQIARECVTDAAEGAVRRTRKIDRILTGRFTGIPVMLALLFFVLWLTVAGANGPSELLSAGLFTLGDRLRTLFGALGAPWWLTGALIDGVYHTTAWVVGVMLPPMAIFFPLFTLLEDFGYLPRVAFNLDHVFCRCGSCGKQSLTMCLQKNRVRV